MIVSADIAASRNVGKSGSKQSKRLLPIQAIIGCSNVSNDVEWRERFGGTAMSASNLPMVITSKKAWNHGRIIGQKRPLLPKHVWAIGVRLELAGATRDLALFNMAVDSKLRGCDLVRLKVADVYAMLMTNG